MSLLSNGHLLTCARAVSIACSLLLGAGAAHAVQIRKVTVVPRDARTAIVKFDVSWEGSWRHEANHDAAWVFFKVRAEGATEWQHVRLAADRVLNPTGYSQEKGGTPLDFIVPDGKDGFTGMFVRRAEYGVGKVAATNVTAVWDLTASKGITKDTKVSVRAFGIEMVFVPEGPFYLGSGGIEPFHFYQYTDGTQHTLPYRVTSAGAIPTGRQPGKLWARKGAQPEDGGEIPAAFPNGYEALYCMKFHITAAQYVGFLNALPREQATERAKALQESWPPRPWPRERGAKPRPKDAPMRPGADGQPYTAGRGYVGVSWADGAAFAAWAGLRPMTELEYEKACRGPMEPGWDTGDDLDHPSYWEVQSINGWRVPVERPVTVGNAAGRRFQGTHGRGTPTLPADWPQEDAIGAGLRGGPGPSGRPSHRLEAATVAPDRWRQYRERGMSFYLAWRGVRTAPKGIGP